METKRILAQPKDLNRGIGESNSCWNCKYGLFQRRSSSPQTRTGHCMYDASRTTIFPESWCPPKKFWEDVEKDQFNPDYEEFLEKNGPSYYGQRFVAEMKLKSGLHMDLEKVKEEHLYMVWMYNNREYTIPIRSMNTCVQQATR
jgi:hypothetical protein